MQQPGAAFQTATEAMWNAAPPVTVMVHQALAEQAPFGGGTSVMKAAELTVGGGAAAREGGGCGG
jgi:hypothetical protein